MTDEKFTERFVEHLLVITGGGRFENGRTMKEYAHDVCPFYLKEPDLRAKGPEACADSVYDGLEFGE